MNIIIPMAGLGTRFQKSGFNLTKPLIQIAGKSMYRHATDCMPLHLSSRLIFVILNNEFTKALEKDINKNYSERYHCEIIILDELTQGQAHTVLKSVDCIDLKKPSLIHNCDTFVTPNIDWQNIFMPYIDGAVVTFEANEDRWSFVRVDPVDNRVVEMKEKQVISSHASTGTYFFQNSCDLIKKIEYVINSDLRENNEFYLSTIYQLMIAENKNIITIPVESNEFLCFGTPQDLVNSLNSLLIDKSFKLL